MSQVHRVTDQSAAVCQPEKIVYLSTVATPTVHRLPNELLLYIFHLAVSFNEDVDVEPISPLLLTKVCRRWEHVTVSNRSLWSNIIMVYPLTSTRAIETDVLLLKSQHYPLDIYLDFRDPDWNREGSEEPNDEVRQHLLAVLQKLLRHVSRWRRLTVLTDTWFSMLAFLASIHSSAKAAPTLQAINLSCCTGFFMGAAEAFYPQYLKHRIPLFAGMDLPQLRQVSLTGVFLDWERSRLTDLTELELKYQAGDVMPTLGDFDQILRGCPRLDKLSIVGWGFQTGKGEFGSAENASSNNKQCYTIPPHEPVTLEHLTSFSLGLVNESHAMKLLSLLRLPALRDLYLEDVGSFSVFQIGHDSSSLLNHVSRLSSRRPCTSVANGSAAHFGQVRSLELRGVWADQQTFENFFGCMTGLKSLSLRSTSNTALLALASSHPARDGEENKGIAMACGDLEELSCEWMENEDIVSTVAARAKNPQVKKLQSLIIESGQGSASLTLKQVTALVHADVARFSMYLDDFLMSGFKRTDLM
ncbi:hypothetical protein AMATHDRAFT_68850 [Amanita thiersii Skay4041]|uniref:F-box domain-containing protein n=1 Tax=Amanita thiersii Skay4041 TaxID=703135 RepID=A0A2A9NC51_9AGAR|nr:hypothetical protein AMATHDRAFT_68850 [Amanita thiersii Skay4041]